MKNLKLLIVLIILSPNYLNAQTVSDYDGNIYNTVQIGTQIWMKENLKSLHYSDGSAINEVWAFNNSEDTAQIYGRLYTWVAAMNGATQSNSVPSGVQGVCPSNWHLPSTAEWEILLDFLGGPLEAGGKMKETNTTHWNAPNTGATNESGFTALPGGYYQVEYNDFQVLGYSGFWWGTSISTWDTISYNDGLSLGHELEEASIWGNGILDGNTLAWSVRCIKDEDDNPNSIVNTYEKELVTYPNPAKDFITLEYPYDIKSIELIDLNGRVVCFHSGNNNTIEVSEINRGIYILKAETDKMQIIRKIILY